MKHSVKIIDLSRKTFLKRAAVVSSVFLFASAFFLQSPFLCNQVRAHCGSEQPSTQTIITNNYFVYSKEYFAQFLQQGKAVVLYFHAPWCTSCSSFDTELRAYSDKLPDNVVVLQVPYDSSPDLKQRYNVTYQHTLVLLDESGNTREMWIGGDLESLLNYLQ